MIPADMKAAVYRGQGKVAVETVPVPPVGPGEVLVKIAAAGLCHSDLSVIEGNRPRPEWTRSFVVPGVNPDAKDYGKEDNRWGK